MSKTVTIPTDGMNPFVVMHNGVKYVYTPGETVEVPDGVALEIEEYKRWREKHPGENVPPFASPIDDITAEVGQTIVVKSVDENGKPTEWRAADLDEWDVHYKANFTEALTEGFVINEVDGKPLKLKEMRAMVKLRSAVDSVWLGCTVTTDKSDVRLAYNGAGYGGVNANNGEYAYFVYHATLLPDSHRAICEFMANKSKPIGGLSLISNEAWLNNWLDKNPINYITGLNCGNNLAGDNGYGYGTEIEIWGKSL